MLRYVPATMSVPTRYVPSENAICGVGVVVTVLVAVMVVAAVVVVTVTGGVVTVTLGAVTVRGGTVTREVIVFVVVMIFGFALAAHTRTFATLMHLPGFRSTLCSSTPAAAVPAANRATNNTLVRKIRTIRRMATTVQRGREPFNPSFSAARQRDGRARPYPR